MSWQSITYKLVALLVAFNYVAYRTELFKDEYNDNHPASSDVPSFARPSLTWETFDKDNAPRAFVVNTETRIELLSDSPVQFHFPVQLVLPLQIVRDKSPPVLS